MCYEFEVNICGFREFPVNFFGFRKLRGSVRGVNKGLVVFIFVLLFACVFGITEVSF